MKFKSKLWVALWTVAYAVSLLVCVASYTITYLTEHVQVASFAQFLYTMQVSMGGAQNVVESIVLGFLQSYSLWIALLSLLYVAGMRFIAYCQIYCETSPYGRPYKPLLDTSAATAGICLCLLFSGLLGQKLFTSYDILGVEEYLQARSKDSTLYESYYVKPSETEITMPEQKKNLIYIFCESMETTFTNVLADPGNPESSETINLIPRLAALAKSGETFGKEEELEGARVTNATSWTVAGMVAQTSGTPLAMGNNAFNRKFENDYAFLPKVESLGEVLEENGYTNYLMVGSYATYAGRANYFAQHGNYEIFDITTAREEGKVSDNYYEWWGFEDSKLFEYAKEKISMLAAQDQPFNFTMLTADTHFSDGYLCPDCPDQYDEQMENVIACTDQRIDAFVSWIQEQSWAKDTVIVITGDHLSMDGLIPQIVPEEASRKAFFAVINGPEYTGPARTYTTLDVFPTTLGALGAQIQGDRLGLGVNLYGHTATLSEMLGFNSFNEQIAYNSQYYDREILDLPQEEPEDPAL